MWFMLCGMMIKWINIRNIDIYSKIFLYKILNVFFFIRMMKIYFIVIFWVCVIYDVLSMVRCLDMLLDVNKLESFGNIDIFMKFLKDIV